MHRAGQSLVGTHDFQSFQSQGSTRRSTVRTVLDLQVRRGLSPFVQSTVPAVAAKGDCPLFPGDSEPEFGKGDRHLGDSEPVPFSAERHVITLEIEANGFLYNMVRCIVGTLVLVGWGKRPESWVAEVLAAHDRHVAGPTAPAKGLCLLWVEHGGNDE